MNFLVKLIISGIIALLIYSLSAVIFNAVDVESYVYSPYVAWFIVLIILYLFLPGKPSSIFNDNT